MDTSAISVPAIDAVSANAMYFTIALKAIEAETAGSQISIRDPKISLRVV